VPIERGEVAVARIVRDVAFEEDDVVAARAEGTDERAPERCMPVASGRGDGEPEHDELHSGTYDATRTPRRTFTELSTLVIA
jgi:hypothetical protein